MSNSKIKSESEIVESKSFFGELFKGLTNMFEYDSKLDDNDDDDINNDINKNVQNDIMASTVPQIIPMPIQIKGGMHGGNKQDMTYDEQQYRMYKDAYYKLKESVNNNKFI